MKLTDRLEVSDDVVSREVGGETVLLDLVSGTYFSVDAVGARIWQIIEAEDTTLCAACDTVGEEYDVAREKLESDVLTFAEQLVEQGLATITP